MTDFTAHVHPVLAVRCPDCGVRVGAWCKRPSEHKAQDLHAARKREADRVFIEQHGERAAVVDTGSGYEIDPDGYAKAHPEEFGSKREHTDEAPVQGDIFEQAAEPAREAS